MIVLYQYEMSPFCDKVRRILRYKKQRFETREVTVLAALGPLKKQNPAGKVPFIEVDGQRVCDSTDIAMWAERTSPDPALLPAERAQRALVHILEDWADESLYWYEVYLRFGIPTNAKRWSAEVAKNDIAPIRMTAGLAVPRVLGQTLAAQGLGRKSREVVMREIDRHLDAVEGLLGASSFLVGNSLTLADIAVFAQLSCMRSTPEGRTAIAAHPPVERWMDRVDALTR